MQTFLHHFSLAAPLFILVFVGYVLQRWGHWPKAVSDALSRFVFSVALPALLFRMMSDLSRLPPVDARLLIAFFGSCFIVFVIGRLLAWRVFRLDGVAQSVFALGGVFSNNVLLGLPLAKATLGDEAVPSVALVLVFNALTLWTLVTVSVEWSRHGSFSIAGFAKTAKSVLTNPIVASILSGTLFGLSGLNLPGLRRRTARHDRPGRRTDGADRARHEPGRVRPARRLAAKRGHRRPETAAAAAGGLGPGSLCSACRRWRPASWCCSARLRWAPTSI